MDRERTTVSRISSTYPNLEFYDCNKEESNTMESKFLPQHEELLKQEQMETTTKVKYEMDFKPELETEEIIKNESLYDSLAQNIKKGQTYLFNESGSKDLDCEDLTMKFEPETPKEAFGQTVAVSTKTERMKSENAANDQLNEAASFETPLNVFKCKLCSYAGSCMKFLRLHMLRRHSTRKKFKCDLCNYSSAVKFDLTRHMRIHSQKKPYRCDKCMYRAVSKAYLLRHKAIHSEKRFKCSLCSYSCCVKKYFNRHMLCHSSDKFMCPICSFSSHYKSSIKKHMRTHTKEKLYKCDQCDYAGLFSSNLARHKQKHMEELFVCDMCSYKTYSLGMFKEHENIHKENEHTLKFACTSCPYTFTKKYKLNQHTKRFHSSEKCYRCDRCRYSDKNIVGLITHMKTHLK